MARNIHDLALLYILALSSLACGLGSTGWATLEASSHHLEAIWQAKAAPEAAFASYVKHYGKVYKDSQEYDIRYRLWLDKLDHIAKYNMEHTSHWLGINQFTDQTFDEARAFFTGYRAGPQAPGVAPLNKLPHFKHENAVPPYEVDWRLNGTVTPVKNQIACGSCWAFSTTGSVESINAITTGKLISLSEQELVDCSKGDFGCMGGWMDPAFQFIAQNGGIDTEADYKYIGEDEKCIAKKEKRHAVTIDGYEDVPRYNETALLQAVSQQPVSVVIDVTDTFFAYAGGIYDDDDCDPDIPAHAVLATGFGHANGTDFWIVKNSWGTEWGDEGYIRMARNVHSPQGLCGIAGHAAYPVKNSTASAVPSADAQKFEAVPEDSSALLSKISRKIWALFKN